MLSPDIRPVPQAKPFLAAAAQFVGGQDTPRAYLERCLDALAVWEPKVGAFVHTNLDGARAAADASSMRAAIGEKLGVAKIHLDLRRGDGPPGARLYNFAALTTTDRFINEQPQVAAAAVRAIVKTQRALKADSSLATRVGTRLFPAEEASLIGDLVARDAPFYDANISPEAVDGLNKFAAANGLISKPVPYDELVAPPFIRQLWNE